MLSTNNNIDFKTVAKNLKKELSKLDFVLSHGATLNLLSRSLGYSDYNTFNAIGGEGIMKNELVDTTFNKAFKQHAEQDCVKMLWDVLYKYGLTHNDDLKDACEWTSKFPFKSIYLTIFQWIEDIYNDGEIFELKTLTQYKLWVYDMFIIEYIEQFLPKRIGMFMSSDICRNASADCKQNFANKLLDNNDFFPKEVLENILATKEELDIAFRYAIAYDSYDTDIQIVVQDNLELLIWLYTTVERANGIFLSEYYNGEKLSDRELLNLTNIKYELKSSNKDSAIFFPVTIVNKLSNNDWQIEFNPLFEKHCIDTPQPLEGVLESMENRNNDIEIS